VQYRYVLAIDDAWRTPHHKNLLCTIHTTNQHALAQKEKLKRDSPDRVWCPCAYPHGLADVG
jgi:hypothetical protein